MKQPGLFDVPVKPVSKPIASHEEIFAQRRERNRFTAWYLDCPNWVCHCGLTMFGRCKTCVNDHPRPASYVENTYPG